MKKLITAIIAVLIACTFSITAFADGEYATAGDLYQDWAATYPPDYTPSYPDYVCGVWSTDGGMTNLTIAVQDNEAGEAGKQEILDLIADDSTVTFVYQKYSKNYLLSIQKEIDLYFENDLGMVFTGVNEYDNRVDIGILEERKNDPDTKKMIDELTEKYGDAVFIECTYAVASIEDTVADFSTISDANDEVNNKHIIVVLCAVGSVFIAVASVVVVRKRSALTLQTNTGENIATSTLSTKEVENMVKSSNTEVPAELDAKIMTEINNK